MKHKTSQAGFTLIELIAVMVILGILAAVIIPRISTLTSGAYESNVRSMYGVIKNEVNAQAIKAAMSGGASGHRETYPSISSDVANYYLKEWVEDYESDYWYQEQTAAGEHLGYKNVEFVAGSADIEAGVFYYMPHGISVAQGGSSTNNNDIYFIHYAPHTTAAGEILGRDYDGFVLKAYRNVGNDQEWGGTNTEQLITDLDWKTPEP